MRERIESLDWLRGLMAISIMVYHLMGWLFYSLDSSSFLGKFGIYGVSVFFVLSGLSMAIVYSNYLKDIQTSISFFIRRIFRIWPLLWIAIALITIPRIMNGQNVDLFWLFANMTTLFGFIKPEAYINTGAWSIGNEVVYYAFTPLIIFLYDKKIKFGDIFTLITFLISCIFSFYLLNREETLKSQWFMYVNPFNNLFLYCAGISLYYHLRNVTIKPFLNSFIFIASILFFIYYPVSGDKIQIVTGATRILFMLATISLVISFYKFNLYKYVPNFISFSLEQFGIATYGVYILHPLIWMGLTFYFNKIQFTNNYLMFGLVSFFSIFFALVSYNLFEKKFMAIGKRITQRDGLLFRIWNRN